MPSTPRVTVFTSRLDTGGAERHLARVLPALKRRGHSDLRAGQSLVRKRVLGKLISR